MGIKSISSFIGLYQKVIIWVGVYFCWLYCRYEQICGGACGVMIIVVGIGHGDTSSNPGRD